MGILSRTPQELVGDKRPEMLAHVYEPNSLTQEPSWLWMFNPDQPERKAAFCAFWRDLMFPEEIALVAKIVGGDNVTGRDLKILERVFARMLSQCLGIDWRAHPNCHRDFLS